MLAMSDMQDRACLRFVGGIGLQCAGRILETVKAVKRRPVEFLCLLTDIINASNMNFSPTELALVMEAVKQAMEGSDEEYIAPFLRPMASGLQVLDPHAITYLGYGQVEVIAAETQRIHRFLQAKYATSLISSTTQLRLLSCARSASVAQPAMGWLNMHVPL
jgi:hypothetical protein